MDICYLACVYRTPSGFCGSTGGAATCPNYNRRYTNANRIRAMTDEELAAWFVTIRDDIADYYDGGHSVSPEFPVSEESWLEWLRRRPDA